MFNLTSIKEFQKSCEETLKQANKINDYVKEFEKQISNLNINKNEYREYFYRNLLEKFVDTANIKIIQDIVDSIMDLIKDSEHDKHKYALIMDSNILLAIRLYFEQDIDTAKEHFITAKEYGEQNIDISKNEYYNALNCAYSWLGAIEYQKGNITIAKEYFTQAVINYNEVKDDPNYNVREKDVIGICQNYLKAINRD